MANEWKTLDKAARLAGTPPTVRKRSPLVTATTAKSQRAIEKNKRELRTKVIKRAVKMIDVGDLGRGARTLGNPQYVITRRNCDEADPTGELWNAVIDKARALHPDDDNPFDEYTECERNDSKPWGCGGISDDIADIHFAAVMTFLLKPAGDPDEVYTQLMTDWKSLEPGQWSIRPIAVGNAHDRTIGRARLGSVRTPIKKHFQSEEVGQYAFGAERGGEMLIIAQNVHQDLHPDDVLASEDGINAYNNAKKDKIAVGMLESDYEEIRGLHRYFLRAHKRPTNIYIAGHRIAMIKGKKGVKQGDPFAGAGYSMGQHHMLLELFFDAKARQKPVRIGAIVDDIAIQGPASHVAYAHQWLKDRGPEWGYYLNEKPGKSTIVPGPRCKRREDTGNSADDEAETPQRRCQHGSRSSATPEATSRATRIRVRANAASALEGVPSEARVRNNERTRRRESRRAPNIPSPTKRRLARSTSEVEDTTKKAPIRRSSTIDTPTRTRREERQLTVDDMFPHTTISNSTKYVGAIVGPDDEARAKQFKKKLAQITHTLDSLTHMDNPRAEFQIIRYCSIAWARFLPTVMPRRGVEDAASEAYVRGIDAAISDQLARLLGDPKVKSGITRAEIALPTCMGGLGIPTLAMIMPGAYMSSLITAAHNIQSHSPRLHKHLMKSIINHDQFYARFTYDQIMEHHDWFDGSDERGEPVYFLPANVKKAMSSAIPTEKQLNANLYARIKHEVLNARQRRIREADTTTEREEEQRQRARLISAGGKYAFQWLHIPPKAARWGLPNINFPGHLFDIALRLRMGLPLKDRMQGNRKCRCKVKGANMGEARWDPHGTHLSAGCAWGGWRTKRHDDIATMMVEWINAAGGRAHERTVGTFPPRGEPRRDGSGRHDTTLHVVTPDLVSTNPQGGATAYDVVVVGVTHKDGFKGAAAARAEQKKHEHYNNHKKKCRDEGNLDARLDVELIPLALEVTGAVGREVKELGKDLKHAYETRVLPISNASAAAAFNDAWVYRISTTLQRGTAAIVYGVTQGEKAPMSAARMAKDQQVVEAVLRDKDPEWFLAQGTELHSSRKRTTQRAKQGSEAAGTTTQRARSTRRVRASRSSATQARAPIVHSRDRSGQVAPQGETETVVPAMN